ncbi:SRPBCC domain-containing protein [Reichenbachiella carrageenanivorans]|uniref:SRPBCC domain-containing protein n=1 Tax=Reichenbachiella carrageenanivorans TaxID=2979869 RepID=A0ABY6D0T6_9BACT|nr:SRPBCC domain-containing protein [Reichenbachiella carrageenanivorans]UXX78678.1 SRPBCC domain-containing protein [Reichenbachiella carrageenanivorans]
MNKTSFTSDKNKLTVIRTFDAAIDLVWRAWTEPELLDLWWAPKPWKSVTKSMDFKENGQRLYAMVGPEGEEHKCITTYKTISRHHHFTGEDAFADQEWGINEDFPVAQFQNQFEDESDHTVVTIVSEYASEEHLQQVVEMGMKEGLSMAFDNLDEYIKQQFNLRSELKVDNKPRVTTYLNFPGNTEEAFTFYKSVFRTEFSGKGIQRFGDIPAEAGHPPVADTIKKMVLHVELPILGGHVLMATDAPKEMGFTLNQGNNMHICLEPDTREETQRLFDELSKDGNITMPLQDMFFGAFFGECSDKYGINWMFNYQIR